MHILFLNDSIKSASFKGLVCKAEADLYIILFIMVLLVYIYLYRTIVLFLLLYNELFVHTDEAGPLH